MQLKPKWARLRKLHDRSRQEFDREDLLDAWLRARRYATWGGELSDYFATRYRGLAAALEVSFDEPPRQHDWINRLFLNTVECAERLRSPFEGYLEEGPEAPFNARHGGAIEDALDRAYEASWALMLECIGAIWDVSDDEHVSPAELRRHGFDPGTPVPDPVDYW